MYLIAEPVDMRLLGAILRNRWSRRPLRRRMIRSPQQVMPSSSVQFRRGSNPTLLLAGSPAVGVKVGIGDVVRRD